MGDLKRAELLTQRALSIKIKLYGYEHKETATTLNNLGLLYQYMNEYSKAIPLYIKSLNIREKKLGPKDIDVANSLHNLGRLYMEIGDYEKAESSLKRSLSICENILGMEAEITAHPLNSMGELYTKKGAYPKAESMIKKALKNMEKARGAYHPETGIKVAALGRLYVAMKEYAKAEATIKRAVAIWEKAYGAEHLNVAISMRSLGKVYRAMGAYDKAEPIFKQSYEISDKVLGPNNSRTINSMNELAFNYGIVGKNYKAMELLYSGVKLQDKVIASVFSIASEEQKLSFIGLFSYGYEAMLSLINSKMRTDKNALRAGLGAVLSRKAIVFDAQALQNASISNSLDKETRQTWAELSSNRAYLAKLIQLKPVGIVGKELKKRIDELQNQIKRLEDQLAPKSPLVAENLEQRKVTVEKVAAKMPSGAALVEFVKIHDFDWDDGSQVQTYRYLAFILLPDEGIELIDLGDAEKLDSNAKTLLAQIVEPPSNIQMGKVQEEAASKLYDLIWAPIAKAVEGVTSVIVSPDGELSLVPFNAIRSPDGKYLAELLTISYVTSGRDLVKYADIKTESDLFLAANPKFDMMAHNTQEQSGNRDIIRSRGFEMTFGPLPGTAAEAKIIPQFLPGSEKKVLTGVQATESAVLSAFRPRVLHLATHGFFLKDQAPLEYGDRTSIGNDIGLRIPKGYENPLVRSGLAFAGANHASKVEKGIDGLLTALEVSAMDLHGTELVTLSACETGVGEVKTGEGVYGLRRAFALAGAKSLMMSLWPVSDEITAEQMKRFYTLYGKGANPAKALREAQLETIAMLREKLGFAPPSLWAPFIMQGGAQSK